MSVTRNFDIFPYIIKLWLRFQQLFLLASKDLPPKTALFFADLLKFNGKT